MPKYISSLMNFCAKCGGDLNFHKQCRNGCDYCLIVTKQELQAMEAICPNCGGKTRNGDLCAKCDGKEPSWWDKLIGLWPWSGRNR